MKIFLLITALSAVFAHDEPNFLRGYDDVLATLEDSCADGEKAGLRQSRRSSTTTATMPGILAVGHTASTISSATAIATIGSRGRSTGML